MNAETDQEERQEGDDRLALTVLAVLGWILPLAGLVWGPGEWWQYAIWLGLGTVAVVAYDRMHPGVSDKS